MDESQNQQYPEIIGEYINLAASIENALFMLLLECADDQNFDEESNKYSIKISGPYETNPLKRMQKANTILSTDYPHFWDDLLELQQFKDLLSQYRSGANGYRSEKGIELPKEITLATIQEKLGRLRDIESIVKNVLIGE